MTASNLENSAQETDQSAETSRRQFPRNPDNGSNVIEVKHLSKKYFLWNSPSARLKHLIYGRLAEMSPFLSPAMRKRSSLSGFELKPAGATDAASTKLALV